MASVPVKCHFCQQEMKFKYRFINDQDVWECLHCSVQTRTLLFDNGTRVIQMELPFNKEIYRVEYWFRTDYTDHCCVYLIKYGADIEMCWTITTFYFIPDWNPTNIKEKLCTTLTFL